MTDEAENAEVEEAVDEHAEDPAEEAAEIDEPEDKTEEKAIKNQQAELERLTC